MKIGCIIQARTGSTRCPGKVMKKIVGKTILELLIERLKPSKYIDEIIVATTNKPRDNVIVDLCVKNNISFFRGSEDDVLDRYYQCAKQLNIDVIVRATSDNPLADYRMMDKIIEEFMKHLPDIDLVANDIPFTFPIGLNMHIMSLAALEKEHKETADKHDREDVVLYIIDNPTKFKVVSIHSEVNLSSERWTLDYEEDYEFIKKVFEALYKEGECFDMHQIIEYLNKNPEVRKINKHLEHKYKYKVK